MLGLGETEAEIVAALDDLKRAAVDIVTFGQYLRPTPNHLPVERYVTPQEFDRYRHLGLERGFLEVVGGSARSVELSRRPRVREKQRGVVSEFLAAYGLFLAQLATSSCCSSSSPCSSRCRAAAAMPRASSSSI